MLSIHRILGYCSTATLLFSIAFIVVISPVPKSSSTTCYTLSCLITADGKFAYTVYRMSYGAVVVVFSIVLAIMVQRKLKLSDMAVRINKIVLKTLVILLLFDFVPYLTSLTLRNIFRINWTPAFAPYTVLSAIDNFFVAWLYSQNIKYLNSAKTAPLPPTHQKLSSLTKVATVITTS
uniref:Serpentine receptor class gamma n=1 Tax=Panagrellus redivivus TaxID=6233 RepID=A0A7E4VB14_PANRE